MNLVCNKASFAMLTNEQQIILREEAKKAGDFMRATVRNAEAKQIEKLKKLGLKITNPDTAPFSVAALKVHLKLKAMVGDVNYETFVAMLAKSNKQK